MFEPSVKIDMMKCLQYGYNNWLSHGFPHPITAQRVPGRTFCDCSGRHTGLTSGDWENGRSSLRRATSKSKVVGSKFGCSITLF